MEDNDDKRWIVYMHVNRINGKKYIGITGRKPEKRWENGHGYEDYTKIGRAIKKYGWENFDHKLLYTNLTKEEAYQKEIELISKYDTRDSNKGYNITAGGDTMAKSLEKPVWQFTLDGDYIDDYPSISSAARAVGGDIPLIARACTREKCSAYGYAWCYQSEYNNPSEFKQDYLDFLAERTKRNMQKIKEAGIKKRKKIYCIDLNGVLVSKYNSVNDVIKQYPNYRSSSITSACRVQTDKIPKNVYKNHYWMWEDEYLEFVNKGIVFPLLKVSGEILRLSYTQEIISEYDSISDAAKSINVKEEKLTKIINTHTYATKGSLWIAKNEYHGQILDYKLPTKRDQKAVIQFTVDKKSIKKFDKTILAAKEIGCSPTTMKNKCYGEAREFNGYLWRYEKDCIQLSDGTYQFPKSPTQTGNAA